MRGECGASRWDGESKEEVYKFLFRFSWKGVDCGVVGWMEQGTLRWFGCVIKMSGGDFVKGVNEVSIEYKTISRRSPVK